VHGLKTLAPHPASPHFEVIAQKVKALPPLPTVSHVGLLGVQTQAIDLHPGFHLRKRRLGLFSPTAQQPSAADVQSFLWVSAPCVACSGTTGAWLSLCPCVSLTLPPSYLPSLSAALLSAPLAGFPAAVLWRL
jgi:hypothetical protein